MSMFYFDDHLKQMELRKDFKNIIKYLEQEQNANYPSSIHAALIGYSWYFFIEGPVYLKDMSDDDLEYFKNEWLKYIEMTNDETNDYVKFIAGYTLLLHGSFLNKDWENKGKSLLEHCSNSKDNNIKMLSKYFLNPKHNQKLLKNLQYKKIFDKHSLLDDYFKEILPAQENQM